MAKDGGAQPLAVHLTIRGHDGAWTTRLIDSTSRKVLKYDGAGATPLEACVSAFDTWQSNNEYPTGGRIVHHFSPAGWSKGDGFETYTTWKRAKEWVDGIITVGGFIVGALLLSDPDPTISKLLGGILVAAVVARSSVAIYERIRDGGDVVSSENVLDAVAVVTSFMGMSGGVLRAAGLKAINPVVYRAGNWIIMGAIAGDVGTFVYVSAEAVAQMKIIQADPTLDDGQKASETMRIMASLFVTGAMLIATNKELLRHGLKPTDFVQSKLTPGSKPTLDVGARLDAEYELKRAGQWTKKTSKLSDEAVLDQVFTHRSRQEIEASLARVVGTKTAAELAGALGNQAFVALHGAFGETKLAAAARKIAAGTLKIMPFDHPAALRALGALEAGELEVLLAKVAPRSPTARGALWSLEVPTLKRIAAFLTGAELEVLAGLGVASLKKLAPLHSLHLRNLATLTPAELAHVIRLDAGRIGKLSALEHSELARAAPFNEAAVDAKLATVSATESHVDAELADPETSHHLRDTNFADRGGKPNAGGKSIKVAIPGKGAPVPIEIPKFVRLEPIPPGAHAGATPTTIHRVEVEGLRADVATKPVVKGALVPNPTLGWEVPVPSSPYPKVAIETNPGGLQPFVDVEKPPPGVRVQIKPSELANRGFAGGHTREAWNAGAAAYGDVVTKTGETGIKFRVPGASNPIRAAAITAEVKVGGMTTQIPDPKTIFERTGDLDAFEAHARPYIAAKIEALQGATSPPKKGQIIAIDVPVQTAAGADAVMRIELPWNLDPAGKYDATTWWLGKSNFAKGSAFNP